MHTIGVTDINQYQCTKKGVRISVKLIARFARS